MLGWVHGLCDLLPSSALGVHKNHRGSHRLSLNATRWARLWACRLQHPAFEARLSAQSQCDTCFCAAYAREGVLCRACRRQRAVRVR